MSGPKWALRRVLIVDDDTAFCRVVARNLHRRGVETETAHDAEAALAAAKRFHPDGILLDLKLGRDNGLNLIQDLRERCPRARIVLATGFASIATAVEAIHRGAVNYLPKPFAVDMLLAAFEYHLEQESPVTPPAEPLSMRRQGWEHLQRVLNECDGNVSATARLLGVDRRTIQRQISKHSVR